MQSRNASARCDWACGLRSMRALRGLRACTLASPLEPASAAHSIIGTHLFGLFPLVLGSARYGGLPLVLGSARGLPLVLGSARYGGLPLVLGSARYGGLPLVLGSARHGGLPLVLGSARHGGLPLVLGRNRGGAYHGGRKSNLPAFVPRKHLVNLCGTAYYRACALRPLAVVELKQRTTARLM
ncbi:hypothetical protein CYMTET_30220 [Cymbomonas tetramitiformis]|uniref:Uncharacterized protein n=1 Tax=Cymbomonas tetramitiformis TaxID=36881 RepID=A0AAE0FJD3_9CHLO|nr:hypothetical protein CYMTET_30220 [Cymbomonas tetramitiformis]